MASGIGRTESNGRDYTGSLFPVYRGSRLVCPHSELSNLDLVIVTLSPCCLEGNCFVLAVFTLIVETSSGPSRLEVEFGSTAGILLFWSRIVGPVLQTIYVLWIKSCSSKW